MHYAYVKDQFVPEKQAVISINERGFRLGDGAFETIRVSAGKSYLLEKHLKRLGSVLQAIRINMNLDALPDLIAELVHKNHVLDGMVRLSVSRGIGSQGYLPTLDAKPTLVIQTMARPESMPDQVMLHAVCSEYQNVLGGKHLSSLPYILAKLKAQENGCFEALLYNRDRQALETSSGNLFWVKQDKCYTTPGSCGIIKGVIRERLLELSPSPIIEQCATLDEVLEATEVFITNASWPILAVFSVENRTMLGNKGEWFKSCKALLNGDISSSS